MLAKKQVYKCADSACHVEVLGEGGCELVCCGKPMALQEEKTADKTTEKHVPLVEKVPGGYKVTVGSTLHPMTDEHYIMWVELVAGNQSLRAFLKPGDAPSAVFKTDAAAVTAREFCNKHGLWKG